MKAMSYGNESAQASSLKYLALAVPGACVLSRLFSTLLSNRPDHI